jgi:hypothetical protein
MGVCPTGALYLVDGKAALELSLCRECEACIPACPTQAIIICEQQPEYAAEPVHTLARRTEPAVIQVESAPMPVPWRARVLPAVGAALAWAGREIVPRLADRFLDSLGRQVGGEKAPVTGGRAALSRCQDAKGRQLRRRRQGRTGDR